MKKFTFSLIIVVLILFLACQPPQQQDATYYKVRNGTSYTLTDVCSYYYTGSNIEDFVMHGDMSPNEVSLSVETEREKINLGLTIGNKTCIVVNPYPITEGITNTLSIYNSTKVYCDDKSGANTIENWTNKK